MPTTLERRSARGRRRAVAIAIALLICAIGQASCAEEHTDTETEASDGGGGSEGDQDAVTYYRDTKSIIDARCAGCHRPGDIAPFSLTSYEEVEAVLTLLPGAIEGGSMPPWSPVSSCREYLHDRSLSPEERGVLQAWFDAGGPAGDPASAPPPVEPPPSLDADLVAMMPEPYAPTIEPDDYRCFVVPAALDTAKYVTAYEFRPGVRELVHHVTVSAVPPSQLDALQALDDADPGPGYTCFGAIGVPGQALGGWVPGSEPTRFPEGTGIRVEAGSQLVLQMHYNTNSAAALADQSSFAVTLADAVERPLATLPIVDFGWPSGMTPMTIPAGEPEVTHAATVALDSPLVSMMLQGIGAAPGDPLLVHQVGMHMHYLGRAGQLLVRRANGDEECALEIADWDFNWQGRYILREPIELRAGDSVEIRCTWDNSAQHQPIIDGAIPEPVDVSWGEGTRDEMCLGSMVVSRK